MKTKRYACPKCGNAVTLHVTPSVAPVCVNPKVHSTTPTSMELVASDDGQRRRV